MPQDPRSSLLARRAPDLAGGAPAANRNALMKRNTDGSPDFSSRERDALQIGY